MLDSAVEIYLGLWEAPMLGIAAGMVALLVAMSTFFYLVITSVLVWKLSAEESETRMAMGVPLLPVFFQNVGIPLAVIGFTVQLTDLTLMGAMMIAMGLALKTENSASLHPAIEAPMIGLAAFAFGASGLFHALI